MGYMGLIIVILVLVFCVGLPLCMITAFLLCHYYGTNNGQDSDEDNNQSHVRERVHLSTSYNHHNHWVRPPVQGIPIQDNPTEVRINPTIIATGLDPSTIASLPTGPIGDKLLIQNPGLDCSICLAEYSVDDIVRRLPCTHAFHVHCIDQWLNHSLVCPICKNNLKHLLHPSASP